MNLEIKAQNLNIWIFVFGLIVLLSIARSFHYLLFHTLAELVAITVSFSIFTLTWTSQKHLKNSYLTILGAAYGTIGVVDVFHTLTFKGMNLFPQVTTNFPTQFWLTARFIEAIALLAAALYVRRAANFVRSSLAFAAMGLIGCIAVWSGALPATFIDGVGLTSFKIVSEYVIVGLLIAGLGLLWRSRIEFSRDVFWLIAGSILLAIATEICFIHYISFYDFINELGHFFRLVSVVLAYLAIVVTGVQRPAELLFRQLVERERQLEVANSRLSQSEGRLKSAQSVSGMGSWHLDIPSGTLSWSDETYRIFAIPIGTPLTLDTFAEHIHPDDKETVLGAWNQALSGSSYDIEHRIISNGQVRWVHERAVIQFAANGDPIAGLGAIQDITARKQAEQAVIVSEAFANATIDAVSEHICVLDRSGKILKVNQAWRDFYAQNQTHSGAPNYGLGVNYFDICDATVGPDAELSRQVAQGIRQVINHELSVFTAEYACHSPAEKRWFQVRVTRFHGDSGNIVVAHANITESRLAEERLQLAASVFSHAREGITITDANGTIVEVNDTFTRITGYSRDEAIGQNPRILKSDRQGPEFYSAMWQALIAEGFWSGEIWNRRKDGELYAQMITISAIKDADQTTRRYVALFSDITPMKEHQNQLEHIAHYDALTNLPNRVLLADRLQQALAQSQRRDRALAVVYLDLDGFKLINDSHGHDVGDKLLIAVAHRMKAALREGDTLARIGGDEFVAVLVDLERPQDCEPVLNRLLQAAADPLTAGNTQLQVSASIGVTIYPQDGADADLLLRHADQAMYQAKQSGKNRYHLFDLVHDAAAKSQRESLEHIRHGFARREFVLFYQPKVNMKSGEVIGAEALIRWQHPLRGLLPPSDFLPVIEVHALSVDLGEWVIDTALAQMAKWHASGLTLPVSVNVGAHQLLQHDFVSRLTALLESHPDVDPRHLELEILETSALEDMDQVSETIHACQRIGVRFALDDFGTGYSSLTYLKRLPAELLKIDQSFIRDMLDDPEDLAIVQGVVGLAAAFHRNVIAEGVESVEHGARLLPLGCELAQGYGIAKPMPGSEMPNWVASWQPDVTWRH